MDTIKVNFVEYNYEGCSGTGETHLIPAIELILNGEKIKGSFDAFTFVLSPLAKKEAITLMTCSCGVPECAGIFDGTLIEVRGNTVEWRDIDSGLPKKVYRFVRDLYEAEVSKAREFFIEIARRTEAGAYGSRDEYLYNLYCFPSVAEFEEVEKRAKERYNNR